MDLDKNALKDILVGVDENENSEAIFRTYKSKNEIADAILNKFFDRGMKKKQKLFHLSGTNKKVGLLSVSQGLISMTLILQMKDLKSDSINDNSKEILAQNILELLRLIGYENENSELHFYATPFVDEKKQNDTSNDDDDDDGDNYYDYDYVDAICKTIQALVECRELLSIAIDDKKDISIYDVMKAISSTTSIYNKEYVTNLKSDNDVVKIFNVCLAKSIEKLLELRIVNDSEIKNVVIAKTNYNIDCVGWNFTNKNFDSNELSPSLFFTYTSTQAYMTFYKNFLDALNHWRNNIEIPENNPKIARDYEWIKNNSKLVDEFRNAIRSSGLYLDEKIKKLDLRSKFLGLDYSIVDMNEIKNSTTNNALFNSIFAVAILIGSGVADIYEEVKSVENRRYFEWLQSIMQNIYDSYCDLLSIRKDYAVSQYILNFNEIFPNDLVEFANYLRKQRIQVLSIVPTMTRVYNMVSSYLINYPQKQMRDYLVLLMNNRRLDNFGKPEWSWDRDNYDVNINTIYIGAMYDFYVYYEKYERQYIETDKKIAELNQKIRDKEIEGNEKLCKEKQEYEEKIAKLNDEKISLIAEKENTPLNNAIKELIKEVLGKELYSSLFKIFDEVSAYLCEKDKSFIYDEDTKNNESIFANKLALLLCSYFSYELVNGITSIRKDSSLLHDDDYKAIVKELCSLLSKKMEDLMSDSKYNINKDFNYLKNKKY